MLKTFKFHHIGIAVNEIAVTASIYQQGGFHCSTCIFDPLQNVNICWLTRDGFPTIELLAPRNEKSPICKTLEKNGVTPYHSCYIVAKIEEAAQLLRKQRYLMVRKPEKAVAFNGSRVAFFFNKNIGLIELVEEPAEIID